MGKYLEIKTGISLEQIRKQLWKAHDVHLFDQPVGKSEASVETRAKAN